MEIGGGEREMGEEETTKTEASAEAVKDGPEEKALAQPPPEEKALAQPPPEEKPDESKALVVVESEAFSSCPLLLFFCCAFSFLSFSFFLVNG